MTFNFTQTLKLSLSFLIFAKALTGEPLSPVISWRLCSLATRINGLYSLSSINREGTVN